MKISSHLAAAILTFCILFFLMIFVFHSPALPSDKKAEAFFHAHSSELNELISVVQRKPAMTYLDANGFGSGTNAADPASAASAKLLKKLGAEFLRSGDGAIEIYFWSRGVTVKHVSRKGFAYIEPKSRLLQHATVVRSLEDKALPNGKYAPIEDGDYILPLDDNWYVFRREQD